MVIALAVIISAFSVLAFKYRKLFDRYELLPYRIVHNKEYHRIFSHAFLHVDYIHLIVNMIVLVSFGRSVEVIFKNLESYDYIANSHVSFLILVVIGILGSPVKTIIKHKSDPGYSAVGASGLVSAVVFAHIFFQPMQKIYFFFAIPIPGILFGVLYLIYSQYMSRRNKDNINHDAHIWGAIIGFLYPLVISPELIHFFIDNFRNIG